MTGRLIAAGALAGAVIASGAAAAPPADVWMSADRIYDVACRCYTLRFSGAISSRAANEYVAIMLQRCGHRFSTAVVGTQTRAGGLWEIEWSEDSMSGTYRAQWNGRLSEPVTIRPPVPLVLTKLPRQRYRVTVNMFQTLQDMGGRLAELQRLAAGGWTRVRRVQMTTDFDPFGQKSFSATFAVPTRGLTMRILVPKKSAAPCYIAGVTKTWVS